MAANAGDVDYFAAGNGVGPADLASQGNYVQIGRLLGLVAEGGTLHIGNLQKYHSGALRLTRSLRNSFRCKVESDLWITRVNSFPAYLHYDSHDIFTIQIHGSKRWRVYSSIEVTEAQASPSLDWDSVADPIFDVILRPGDVLYMPAFTPHAVTTTEAYSVHVGVGVHPISWRELLEAVLDESRNTASSLQKSIPTWLGTADRSNTYLGQLRELAAGTIDAAFPSLVDQFIEGQSAGDSYYDEVGAPPFPGLLGDCIDGSTLLCRRNGLFSRAWLSLDKRAHLEFSGGGLVKANASALEVFRFAAEYDGAFTAAQLTGELTLETKIILLTRLVEVGFLTRADWLQ